MVEIIFDYLDTHAEFPLLVGMFLIATYALIENIKLHSQYNRHKKSHR